MKKSIQSRAGIKDTNTVDKPKVTKVPKRKYRIKTLDLGSHSRFKTGAEEWLASLNWEDLKDEFFTTLKADGTYVHASVHTFARDKYPNHGDHRRWVLWSIGPSKIAGISYQGDWDAERLLDRVKYSKQVQALQEKIDGELDILAAGKVLADSYLPFQERVFTLFKELETTVNGKILLDTSHEKDAKKKLLLEKANSYRMESYMKTLDSIVNLKVKVDNQFLKCLGWDRPQFIAYFEGLRNQEKNNGKEKAFDTNVQKMLHDLAQNQIEKAQMYDLELPDDIQDVAERIKAKQEKE